MADRGDHRDRRGRDRPCNRLFVECPEVLERTAAPPDDKDVDTFLSRELVDAAGDLAGRTVSLHAYGANDDVGRRVSPGQDLEDVPKRRAVKRGDDPDLAGEHR